MARRYEVGKDFADYYTTSAPKGDQILEATKPNEVHAKAYTELDTIPLYREAYQNPTLDRDNLIQARIELHQRLALPPACFLLALIGIPLGVSSRKGGKSAAFVLTVALAFIYWIGLIGANALAKQQTLPVGLAMWIPNLVFAALGIVLIARLERPGDRDVVGALSGALRLALEAIAPWHLGDAARSSGRSGGGWRFFLVPQVIDTYVLTSFLFYFLMLLASFVLMTQVFTFFELLSDIVKNHIAMDRVFTYLFFLTPQLIYDAAPLSVLVAVLVTFGILTKHNEITAFKATGISLYRLAVPVLVAALALSGALFAFDHYYVPGANRKQDAIRKEIKGKPVQTYLHPERQWIFDPGTNNDPRIFYYKYLDPVQRVMVGPQVYELDPSNFRLRKHIAAEKARWEPALRTWIFENGWSRDFTGRQLQFVELQRPSCDLSGDQRASRLFPAGSSAGPADEFPATGRLHPGLAAQRHRDRDAAGALLPEIRAAAVRPGDGVDLSAVRVRGRKSRGHGGRGRQPGHRHRLLVDRHAVRATGRREPAAGGHGGVVARRAFRDGGHVFLRPHADLKWAAFSLDCVNFVINAVESRCYTEINGRMKRKCGRRG